MIYGDTDMVPKGKPTELHPSEMHQQFRKRINHLFLFAYYTDWAFWFGSDSRSSMTHCWYPILEQCESPLLKLESQTKTSLPLVQMSKAFMKIPNVIQPYPTNKDLLFFAQTQ